MFRLLTIAAFWCLAINSVAQPLRNEWIDYGKTYYKFPVADSRLCRISKSVLTAAGIGNVPAEHFQLWRNGEEVPVFVTQPTGPLPADGFIEFLGRRNDGKPDTELYDNPNNQVNADQSYFSDTSWYYLTINTVSPNKRILAAPNNVATSTQPADSFYMHQYRNYFFYQWNQGSGVFVTAVARPDRTFGDAFRTSAFNAGEGWASQSFNTDFPYLFVVPHLQVFAKGPAMQAAISVSGNYQLSRNVTARVNGQPLFKTFVPSFNMRRDTVNNIPASLVASDTLKVLFSSDNPYYWDNSVANVFSLLYPRKFVYDGEQYFVSINLPANAMGNHLRLKKFNSGLLPPVFYDLTNNLRYVGLQKADSALVQLLPSATPREIAVTNQSFLLQQIAQLQPKQFINFADAAQQGNYLIVTNKLLRRPVGGVDPIESYRQYRSSVAGGAHKAQVYDIDELAEQFAFGMRQHPLAIKNFVRFAQQRFSVKPSFLVLIGKGTYYASLRATGAFAGKENISLLPTFGLPASDNMLVSVSNLNPSLLIPIGRISAVNGEEVLTYLQKVKDYEAIKQDPTVLAENGDWQKRVIHMIGGDNAYLADTIIRNYIARYRREIEGPQISGKVSTYKRVNNPNFASEAKAMDEMLDKGVGLMTYFGHSSATSIDFGLKRPEDYKYEPGKYPIFVANGCLAGNIFDFNTTRILSKNISLAENYLFAKNSGAIAVIANSSLGQLNALDRYTFEWYKAIARTAYGKSLGDIHREAVFQAYNAFRDPNSEGQNIGRFGVEQMLLHGDPAVVPYPFPKPDYAVTSEQISISPVHPLGHTDSVWVTVKLSNIGRIQADTIPVKVKRKLPNGTEQVLLQTQVINLYNNDSVRVKISFSQLFQKGENTIIAIIDEAGRKDEMSKLNNTAQLAFHLEPNAFIPVFPYNYAIVNNPAIALTASTENTTAKKMSYRLQVDTTALFNSPMLYTADTISIGGAIRFSPTMAWKDNTVYYWRTSPLVSGIAAEWNQASFLYKPGEAPGFNQSHFFQHQQSMLDSLLLPPASRTFEFGPKPESIFIEHGIYPTSGYEDTHFSVMVNGKRNIYSACVGASIIFNLFDAKTLAPWDNSMGNRFGSGFNCGPGRENNFEFSYFNAANRKIMMDFIDGIPSGTYVVARMVLDAPYDSSYATAWMKDTLIHGKNRSLFHLLKAQGFYAIDSLNKPRTFAFVFQKNDSSFFKPFARVSDGLYDRIHASVFINTRQKRGSVVSPALGPSASWLNLQWQTTPPQAGLNPPPFARLDVFGVAANGQRTLLQQVETQPGPINISSIDAVRYPYLQLRMQTYDSTGQGPAQLNYWRLQYQPVADGALSPAAYFKWSGDTIITRKDTLQLGIAFKNISSQPLDSTTYQLWLGQQLGGETLVKQGKLALLAPGDTTTISYNKLTDSLSGQYYLKLEVNGMQKPIEQHWFNNKALLAFFVDTAKTAVELVDFAVRPLNNNVEAIWQVKHELKVAQYQVLFGLDSVNMQVVATQLPQNNGVLLAQYQQWHTTPQIGKNFYRLKIIDKYGQVTLTPAQWIDVSISGWKASALVGKVGFTWSTGNEIKMKTFVVEHRANPAANWATVFSQAGTNSGAAVIAYQASHTTPSLGTNHYRLRVIDDYGKFHFSQTDSVTLSIADFSVTAAQFDALATWTFNNEINIADYQLENSRDSVQFKTIATAKPGAGGAGNFNYTATHGSASPGYHYYRLKATDKNGNVQYSAVRKVFIGDANTVIVYPNPFRHSVQIVMADNVNTWELYLYDVQGRLVKSQKGKGSATLFTGTLPNGTYLLKFVKGETHFTKKLLKQ